MKQSKKLPPKVELVLPDFISIGRYKTWLENETHKTLRGKLFACEALTLNTQEELKSIPVAAWEKYYELATNQLLDKESLTPLLIKYKGEVIGINLFAQKTIGEVADTEIMLSGGEMLQIARTMLTPVEEYTVDEKDWIPFGVDDAGHEICVRYLVDVKIDSKKYRPREYTIENLLPEEYFKDFPVKLYNSVLDFILRAGIPSFIQTSAPCSTEQEEARKDLMREMLKIQVGLRQSFILEKLLS